MTSIIKKKYFYVKKLYSLNTLVLKYLKIQLHRQHSYTHQEIISFFYTFHGFSYLCKEYVAYNENVAEIVKIKSKMILKNIQLKINVKK